jgi:hypothetical protein
MLSFDIFYTPPTNHLFFSRKKTRICPITILDDYMYATRFKEHVFSKLACICILYIKYMHLNIFCFLH